MLGEVEEDDLFNPLLVSCIFKAVKDFLTLSELQGFLDILEQELGTIESIFPNRSLRPICFLQRYLLKSSYLLPSPVVNARVRAVRCIIGNSRIYSIYVIKT